MTIYNLRAKLSTIILLLIFVFIALWGRSSRKLNLTSANQESIYYVKIRSGEEYLCWSERCGWTRIYPVEFITTQDTINSISAIVNKDLVPEDILIKKKILTYSLTDKTQYSPLAGFIFGKTKIVIKMNTSTDANIYLWDKNDESLKVLDIPSQLYPLQIQPEEKLLLLGEVSGVNGKIDYSIYSLISSTHSSPMQLSSFSWVGEDSYKASEYIGIQAKTPEYLCPFYADIHNCLSNKRSRAYINMVSEKQKNALDFSWISLSLPEGWTYFYEQNEISGKKGVFKILSNDVKLKTLSNLLECYSRDYLISGLSSNKKKYLLSKYSLKAACIDSQLELIVIQIQHSEFKNARILLSPKPLLEDFSQSDLMKEINLFNNSLKNSVLY